MAYQSNIREEKRRIPVPLKSLIMISLFLFPVLFLAAAIERITTNTSGLKTVNAYSDLPIITSVVRNITGNGINAKKYYAAINDDKDEIWFLSEVWIISGNPFRVPADKKTEDGPDSDKKYHKLKIVK